MPLTSGDTTDVFDASDDFRLNVEVPTDRWVTSEQIDVVFRFRLGRDTTVNLLDEGANETNATPPNANSKSVVWVCGTHWGPDKTPLRLLHGAIDEVNQRIIDEQAPLIAHPNYIIPINVNGNHWVYLLLKPREPSLVSKIVSRNPLAKQDPAKPEFDLIYLDPIVQSSTETPYRKAIIDAFNQSDKLSIKNNHDISRNHQQSDCVSCGVVGAEVILRLLKKDTIPTQKYFSVEKKLELYRKFQLALYSVGGLPKIPIPTFKPSQLNDDGSVLYALGFIASIACYYYGYIYYAALILIVEMALFSIITVTESYLNVPPPPPPPIDPDVEAALGVPVAHLENIFGRVALALMRGNGSRADVVAPPADEPAEVGAVKANP